MIDVVQPLQPGVIGTLTSLAVRSLTSVPTAGKNNSLPSFAAGDSNGGMWVFRRTAVSDAYTIIHALPRWTSEEQGPGAIPVPTPAVTSVAWRDNLLIGGASDGRMAGWELSDGAYRACSRVYPP